MHALGTPGDHNYATAHLAPLMVIFIPPGDESDPTRTPALYDETYRYLAGLGVAEA